MTYLFESAAECPPVFVTYLNLTVAQFLALAVQLDKQNEV